MLDVSPNPPTHCEDSEDTDDKVESMKPRLERVVLVPLLTQLLADVRESQTPWQ